MKMGIKEFRERISEVSLGDEVVIVTHHGKRVGRYIPEGLRKPAANIDMTAWVKEREEFGRRWRAHTPNWRELLREIDTPEFEIAEIEEADRCS
jgi:antitoxin (DNA-binding transcriptional repressor) of toxin-antitoxin stability system